MIFLKRILFMVPLLLTTCALMQDAVAQSKAEGAAALSKNFSEIPPAGYTGTWMVYATNTGRKWIESQYAQGVKNGTETRWYVDTGNLMSSQMYNQGVLEGKVIKYSNHKDGAKLVEGVYKSGKPWEGTFLEGWDHQVNDNPQIADQDVPYQAREYRSGELLKRFSSPQVRQEAAVETSGSLVEGIFDWCVRFLLWLGGLFGMSYKAINVWIFCVLWPAFTILLMWVVIRQRQKLRALERGKLEKIHQTD